MSALGNLETFVLLQCVIVDLSSCNIMESQARRGCSREQESWCRVQLTSKILGRDTIWTFSLLRQADLNSGFQDFIQCANIYSAVGLNTQARIVGKFEVLSSIMVPKHFWGWLHVYMFMFSSVLSFSRCTSVLGFTFMHLPPAKVSKLLICVHRCILYWPNCFIS